MLKLFFLFFSGLFLYDPYGWSQVIIKLFDIISIAVSEYFIVFNNLFSIAFTGTLKLINNLVSEYFIIFNNLFNMAFTGTLNLINDLVTKYFITIKYCINKFVYLLLNIPNYLVLTIGIVCIIYIIKK